MLRYLLTDWHWLVALYVALLTGVTISAVTVDLRKDNA